jgi:hypothetical protein
VIHHAHLNGRAAASGRFPVPPGNHFPFGPALEQASRVHRCRRTGEKNRRKFMKSLLAAAVAAAMIAGAPAIAADNQMPNHDAPGKSTNSDGTAGTGADGTSTGDAGSEAPGKSTNSDGSTGAAANAPGTSINDGAGSTEDQKPASGANK